MHEILTAFFLMHSKNDLISKKAEIIRKNYTIFDKFDQGQFYFHSSGIGTKTSTFHLDYL